MVQVTQAVQVSRMIKAVPSAAYKMLTRDVGLREWLSDGAYAQPRDGGKFLLAWNSGFAVAGTFETREQDKQVAFTWQVPGDPEVSHIRVNLESAEDGTRVTVRHEGPTAGPNGRAPQQGWEAALEVLQSVLETGDDFRFTRRPMLGIMVGELNDEVARRLNLPNAQGILVDDPIEGMGAKAAGLTKEDVIVRMGGHGTPDFTGLVAALEGKQAGDTVAVEFWRGSALQTAQMTLSGRVLPEVPPTAPALADAVQAMFNQINAELDEVLKGVTEAEASHHPGEGEWNVKDVIAHLTFGERDSADYLGTLVSGDEALAAQANLPARVKAFAVLNPTLADARREYQRAQQELVELIRHLPDEFVAHKPTYVRFGQNILQGALHPQEHFEQMRAAIASARA
jgi:uncharacterized protein YndB with AHSA1/START domain